ncbi:MAG: TatD family hydrolase [Patescibacteria group bacterium]|jgi:TatD DNase family protein
MPKYIDTHAHLDSDIYAQDLDIVVKHAQQNEVWAITLGSDYASSKRAVEIAERYPNGVYAAIGLHPLKVSAEELAEDKLLDLEKFSELARHPKVVALGECGLDYHELPDVPRRHPQAHLAELIKANQKKVLRKFLQLSEELRLPLLLHCREAHDDLLELLETWDKTSRGFDCRGIVHCYSGNWKQARRYFNVDFMLSLTGLLTHGSYQTEIIKKAPLTRLVLESDCPHLTPDPFSIRRNEPSYLLSVAAAVAGIRGASIEEVSRTTTDNALKVLNKLRP